MASFVDFILACETEGGGVLLRDYLALGANVTKEDLKQPDDMVEMMLPSMKKFFESRRFDMSEEEMRKLCKAKMYAQYLSIDYEFINGPGMSY
jgi:hypothetical protein